jgi:hypothetical protein
MLNTLESAIAVRDKDVALTDWRYHEFMGVYCRFGNMTISIYQGQEFGGLYMSDVKSVTPSSGPLVKPMNPAYWSTVRVPVGFEIIPRKFPGYPVLARLMHMTQDEVQDAYEHVLIHGQGLCSVAWSTN